MKEAAEIQARLAETLHDQLGQQLAGTLLAAGALSARLVRRGAPEAREAAYLLDMIMNANKQLSCLITDLDDGKPR
jgi:signal transduction histidine kinase